MLKGIVGFILVAALLSQFACLVCEANDFTTVDQNIYVIAGKQYTCTAIYDGDYNFEWSSSSGYFEVIDKNTNSTIIWIAPDVTSSTEITISVLVTTKRCKCQAIWNKTITVLPTCIEGQKIDKWTNDGISGWSIALYNATGKLDEKTTDAEGRYVFCGLSLDDEYTVCEVQQDRWTPIVPADGCYHNITLNPGENKTLDFYNDPSNLTITKEADKNEVNESGVVNYTITVCNHGETDVANVTVWDVFNRPVEILSMTPPPDPDGRWRFDVIPADECEPITISIKVPERQDFEFGMEQGVSGEGFVNVANDYSTTFEEYLIKNCARATSDWNAEPISACVTITVDEEIGTRLETREYGSGLFDAEERVAVFTENKSIEWEEDVSATYKPTSITLYQNRTVDYDSAWVKKARAKNYITGTTMTETYHDASWLDRESRIFLDKNESVMEVDSAFDGRGHVGFLKMPTNRSSPKATPLIEVREEYVGSFKVVQKIDEYGKGVSYEKAASGGGLVVGDRRIGSTQRSYESGSGSYDSEEVIETYTSYIAKDISLVYAPTTTRLTDDVWINSSMKWKEGIYSRVPERSYIGEEYTGASELDKETVARGLNEMDTVADFSGQARYRAVFADPNDTAEPFIEFDEAYSGDYSIERRVLLTGTSKYDRPHLNVTKTLDGIVEERDRCDGDNCTKTKQVATYTIRIENDGNSALGPIYVRDLFPPGAVFIESSLRPSELTETTANWTLTHIAIGGAIEIVVKLDVTKYYPSEIVNRVEVCGGKDVDWVCFGNYSAWEMNWLTCCLNETVSVVKTGEVDEANGSVVRYRIEIDNLDAVTRVATVTDHLPAGMTFLESSTDIASYDGVDVVWNLIVIGPFETRTIEFSALAPGAGRYTNAVIVDPRSVDGPVVGPVTARCVVEVGSAEECGPISCGGWSPPNWDLQHSGNEPDEMTCDQLTGTGTGSCPAP